MRFWLLLLLTACNHSDGLPVCTDCQVTPDLAVAADLLTRATCGDCAAGQFCTDQNVCWPCYSCNNDPTCGCCGQPGQACCLSLGAHVACRANAVCVQEAGAPTGICHPLD
jgi:hypothetical protein